LRILVLHPLHVFHRPNNRFDKNIFVGADHHVLFNFTQYGGGLKIKKYILTKSIFHIYLEDDSEIEVSHSASAPTFKRIDALLLKELGSRRNA